jgi:hypothetical protein
MGEEVEIEGGKPETSTRKMAKSVSLLKKNNVSGVG